jgi:Domain of unknown function (DUF4158)
VPVEFLSDAAAAMYRGFNGDLSREDLDRVFLLDDANLELIERRRGDHHRFGFALQLGTVRWLGAPLPDLTAVPSSVRRTRSPRTTAANQRARRYCGKCGECHSCSRPAS